MSRLRRTALAVVGALVLGAGAACDGEPPAGPPAPPTTTPSPTPTGPLPSVGADCRDLATQGLTRRLTNAANLSLAAVEYGSGPMGVVLVHQSDASMCQWLPYAVELAERGYRVVAFDFAGYGTSSESASKTYVEDIRTVVTYLRDRGTTRVVVIGASMGATMSVVAAAAITPPLQGVVAISAPLTFEGVDAERAAPHLGSPALFIAGESDGDYDVYAEELSEATSEALRRLLVVDSPEHGVELVGAETLAGAQVRAAIEEFLDENLRPTAFATPTR